ncbi:LytS/YehU family sensor histidine kinase [Algoriphagus sp. 4150]|uniref:sensor histidine kinase n=1 Tax=Algoriphagus sp. 4150 TaxID=2817756 RepID=UPI00285FED51|nr:histidine kinase [Algoriphagus sp. 4150]MDR7129071.1 LytS/YehU family sensor histidine kinase [Algoriphagus sp. 4150]
MFSRAFSNPTKSNWIIQGAGVIWFLGTFGLLLFYGVDQSTAIVDSLVFAMLFSMGVTMLDRVFGFYIPKGSNNWLLLGLPLVFSFVAVLGHQYMLKWVYSDKEMYVVFLKSHFYLRWTILSLAEILVALIAIVVSKLEQQDEAQKREAMMNELSREAELTQLRQQLQPHFLFNSLNSISALTVSQPAKAREMVLQLSDFLRGTIRKDHQQWVSLEEELSYLKMYLDIEHVRFGHRLEVVFEVSDEVKQMRLPQLLIQPLLENAIKHGLYGITEDVKITLQAFKEQNYLMLKIENPFDPEMAAPKGTGFGLSSVDRRLFLLFGRKDLLESKSTDSIFSVILKIPQQK